METDLIHNRGVDLPGFAAHPVVDTDRGRGLLADYFARQIAVASEHGLGITLESPTWMANRDRGGAIGAEPGTLARRNREAIALMDRERTRGDCGHVVPSGSKP